MVVEGTVYVKPNLQISKAGKEWGFFVLRIQNGLVKCLCFEQMIKKACKELKELSMKVRVSGKELKNKDEDYKHILIVDGFSLKDGEKKISAIEEEIRKAGGIKKFKEGWEQYKNYQESKGIVPVTILLPSGTRVTQWQRKDNVIEIAGEYRKKCLFCIEVLGAKKTTELLEAGESLDEITKLALCDYQQKLN